MSSSVMHECTMVTTMRAHALDGDAAAGDVFVARRQDQENRLVQGGFDGRERVCIVGLIAQTLSG
jgi:hypothetical protein